MLHEDQRGLAMDPGARFRRPQVPGGPGPNGFFPDQQRFGPPYQRFTQQQRFNGPPQFQNPMDTSEEPAQLRKLFVGGLHHETNDVTLHNFYARFGRVVDAIVMRDPATRQSRGFGFVTFARVIHAEEAMNARPHIIDGKTVDPKRAIPRDSPALGSVPVMGPAQTVQVPHQTPGIPPWGMDMQIVPAPGCKVIIHNVHREPNIVDALRVHFESFGVLDQVEVYPDGTGFLVFEKAGAAAASVAARGSHVVAGQTIEVLFPDDEE